MKYRGFPNIHTGLDDKLVASKLGFAKTLVGIAQRIQGRTGKHFVRLMREVDGVLVEVLAFHNQSIIKMRRTSGEEEVSSLVSRLLWMPEGFNLRILNAASLTGYGLPFDEDNPLGTPGGPVRDVLINRFENNLYPDAVIDFGIIDPATHFFVVKHDEVDDTADEMPRLGLRLTAGSFERQFANYAYDEAAGFVELGVFEEEDSAWYCHRPTPFPYTAPFNKAVFDRTNALRGAADVPEAYPPLRGWYNTSAVLSVREMVENSVMAHSSNSFTPGHKYARDRIEKRIGHGGLFASGYYGENIQFSAVTPNPTAETGEVFAAQWASSPTHYPTMVRDWGIDGPDAANFLEIAHANGRIAGSQHPPYKLDSAVTPFDPPVAGLYATQVFTGVSSFVGSAPACWEGTEGRVSWNGLAWHVHSSVHGFFWQEFVDDAGTLDEYKNFDMRVSPGRLTTSYLPGYRNAPYYPTSGRVFVRGRSIDLFNYRVASDFTGKPLREVRGAALSRDGDRLRLNALVLSAPWAIDQPCRLQLVSKLLSAPGVPESLSEDDFELLAEYELPLLTEAVSGASFSASGTKCVITAYVLVPNEGPCIHHNQWDFGLATTTEAPIYGSEAVFLEFTGLGVSVLTTERATVEVTAGRGGLSADPDDENTNWYNATCLTSYKIMADYDGETVRYLEVEVDIETRQATAVDDAADERVASKEVFPPGSIRPVYNQYSNTTKLVFPSSDELECVNMQHFTPGSPVHPKDEAFSLLGTVVQLAHLDMDKSKCVYNEMTVDTTLQLGGYAEPPKVDYRLMHGATELFARDDVTARFNTNEYLMPGVVPETFIWNFAQQSDHGVAVGAGILSLMPVDAKGDAKEVEMFAASMNGWWMTKTHWIASTPNYMAAAIPKVDYVARITPPVPFLRVPILAYSRFMKSTSHNIMGSITPFIQPTSDCVAFRADYKGESVVAAHVVAPFNSAFEPFTLVRVTDGVGGREDVEFEAKAVMGIDRFVTDSTLNLSTLSGHDGAKVGFAGVVG